jgi:predicted Ser/Thr protein kinase
MGVVYKGWDPQLERPVAVKLLRPDSTGSAETLRARLLREAQAMARLSHPNVLTIYEIGTHEEKIFIAMEFVDGPTLKAWLRAERRSWREVLKMFLAAGEGLAAAHSAGIVHRDFKPENVLVSSRGQVFVTDFGLARVAGAPAEARALDGGISVSSERSLTASRVLVGTPAYMSPEQIEGHSADVRTDVFSFAVSLYEGIAGARPFTGENVIQLRAAMDRGVVAPPVSVMPRWVLAPIRRALRVAADERTPSMAALLAELRDDPVPRWRWRALTTGAAAAVLISAGVARHAHNRAAPCSAGPARAAAAWDATKSARLKDRFVNHPRAFVHDLAARVIARLDARSASWAREYTDACEATRVRGDQSEELLDRRMRCLDERLAETAAAVELLSREPTALPRASEVVDGLTPIGECANARAMAAAPPVPRDPAVRARIEGLRRQLVEERTLLLAAKYDEGLALARKVADASTIDPGTHAEALYELGRFQLKKRVIKDALMAFYDSQSAAQDARDDRIAALSWSSTATCGFMSEDDDLVQAGLRAGWASLRRFGGDLRTEANLTEIEGELLNRQKRYSEALEKTNRTIELRQKVFGPESVQAARTIFETSILYARMNRHDEARAVVNRAIAILEKAAGPGHPEIATALDTLAESEPYTPEGYERKVAIERRATAIAEAALGADHPSVGYPLWRQSVALIELGRAREARPLLERVVALFDKKLPARAKQARLDLGIACARLQDWPAAAAALEPSLDMQSTDPALARNRFALAQAYWELGKDRPRALVAARAARAQMGNEAEMQPSRANADEWLARHR